MTIPVSSRITFSLSLVFWLALSVTMSAQASAPGDASDSWKATSTQRGDYTNPTRTTETHTQSTNRTVDLRSTQVRDFSGQYVPYQDIETETVQVDANTVRTTTRSFGRGPNGDKILVQVTEENKLTLPDGGSNVIRAVSNPDVNGRLQLVRRENEQTRKISPGVEETNTTVSMPSVNGGFAPVVKVQERRQEGSNNTIESQKTTLLPDGAGKWQVSETRKSVSQAEGKSRTTEDRVAQRDFEGNLGEVSRTVSQESESAPGQKQQTTVTHSLDRPGSTRDGSMRVVQRVNTSQQTSSSGQQATTQVEQPNPGDPSSGLQSVTVTDESTQNKPGGSENTMVLKILDSDGKWKVLSQETTESTKPVETKTPVPAPK